MSIYKLYVKTHNKTGLKYLGQTTAEDPHKYRGSGVDWLKHLNEHGNDYTTEILKECQSKEERNEWGRYYSNLWNVAKSSEWANRIPETGAGSGSGPHSPETIAKILDTKLKKYGTLKTNTPKSITKGVNTRRKNGSYQHTPETIAKIKETMKRNSKPRSPESIAKGKETSLKNGSYAKSPETVAKILATRKKNGTLNTTSPESITRMIEAKKKNGSLNATRSPESVAKTVATRQKNGSYAKSPEIIAKMLETRRKNKILRS
jgi:hypothetical protein